MGVLLMVLVFLSALGVDLAHVQAVRAITEQRSLRAAVWSTLQWGAACVGFVIAVKVTLWALVAEGSGLFLGTLVGMRMSRFGKRDTLTKG